MQNIYHRFVLCSNCQIYGGDFAKFWGLPRIYELYQPFLKFKLGPKILMISLGLRGSYACQPRNDTFNVIMTSNDTDPLSAEMLLAGGLGGSNWSLGLYLTVFQPTLLF